MKEKIPKGSLQRRLMDTGQRQGITRRNRGGLIGVVCRERRKVNLLAAKKVIRTALKNF